MILTVGSRYGSIGVEICDEHGPCAVVARHDANRLNAFETKAARRGLDRYEELERQKLAASGDAVLLFATELVRRWNAGEAEQP